LRDRNGQNTLEIRFTTANKTH